MSLRKLTFLFLFIALQTSAEESMRPCEKVVIAGDSQWPPYTIVDESSTDGANNTILKLSGIGIELARKIFKELDVPVEELAYNDQVHMMQGLRDGEIDLIVSSYDHTGISMDVQLLQPAYVIDPITVAVPIALSAQIKSWENLAGLDGITMFTFVPDDQTNDFINSYLNVSHKDFLLAALQSVKNGKHKYILGSDYQLTYAIKANNMSSDLIVMKNLLKGGDVHMAFAKNSVCQPYAYYVQKRLQDYKNNGTVEKLVKKYIY